MSRFALKRPWFIEIVVALLFSAGAGIVVPEAALAQATTDTVWIEDALPAGAVAAGTGESWSWIGSNPPPFSGTLSHQSAILAGIHQHYFSDATATMAVGAGDTLFTYVWLDPANPPSEIMLQWNDGSEETWNHRAYWGANLISWGIDGTVGRRYMGPLPALGQWVKLAIPAEMVALEGTTVSGMAFALYNGRASWDRSGTTSQTKLLVRGSVTAGATPTGAVAFSGGANATCAPSDSAGGYVCAVPYGWSGTITPQSNGYTFSPPSRSYSNLTSGVPADNYSVVAGVDISPRAAALVPSGSTQFTAVIVNSAASLVWAVDGIVGGNAAVGTISSTGLYTAPATTGTHAITATLQGTSTAGSATAGINNYRGVFTAQNDNARTSANQSEVLLTPANVGSTQFGKLFSLPVDGEIYAQPLYVANVAIPGQGTRNVVYVATQHDSVYAFDADGNAPTPLWQVNFLGSGITTVSPADVDSDAYLVEIGIASTPVIDPATSTIYVLAYTAESGRYVHRLHALDLATGAEKFGGPVVVAASSPGSDPTSRNGRVPFIPFRELQRTALLLSNNVVYLAFASHGDHGPFHGWVLGYDAQSLQQVGVHNTTPDGVYGGIWMSGGGLAADASNNVYFTTGNGTFDRDVGGNDLGDSFVKLGAVNRALTVTDYFTPYNEANLETTDYDFSAGGIVLFPGQSGQSLAVGISKGGVLYLVDRNSMGHFQPGSNSQIPQSFQTAASLYFSSPTFWQNYLYVVPAVGGAPAQYQFTNGTFTTTPFARGATTFKFPGAVPAVSSNGASKGIMWLLESGGWKTGAPAILHAYDATNIAVELYNSSQAGTRDTLGPAIKFSIPTIANGKVYAGTGNALAILGSLTTTTNYQVSGTVSGAVASGVGFTATGGVSCTSVGRDRALRVHGAAGMVGDGHAGAKRLHVRADVTHLRQRRGRSARAGLRGIGRHRQHGVGRGCRAGGGHGDRRQRRLELDRQQPRTVLGGARPPVGAAGGNSPALLLRGHRDASGGRGRYALYLRVSRSGESAERDHAAVERWIVVASRVLGSEPHRVGNRRHGEPALHGGAAGDRAVGEALDSGLASGPGRQYAQRHGVRALQRARDLGLRRQDGRIAGNLPGQRNGERCGGERSGLHRYRRRDLHEFGRHRPLRMHGAARLVRGR